MKYIRKIVLLILLLIPINCLGLTYELVDPTDGSAGTKFYKIKISDVTEETKTDKLSCATSKPEESSCLVEPVSGYQILDGAISKDSSTESNLLENNSIIGRIVITNKTSKDDFKVDVSLMHPETNEDGETTTKSVMINNVTISAALSGDSTLKSLSVSVPTNVNVFPAFDKELREFTIYNISSSNQRIKFKWECDNCSVKFEGGTEVRNNEYIYLKEGSNDAKMIVTSQDGNNNSTYFFTIIRGNSTFNSDKLKSIKVDDYEVTPEFKDDIKEYQVIVPKKITNLDGKIKAETEDPSATVTIEGANKLDKDENTVKITVKAQDERTNEYNLKVIREDNEEEIIEVIYYKNKVVAFMNVENVREELSEDKFKEKYPNEWKKIENKEYKFDEEGNIVKNQQEEPPVEEEKKEEPIKEESSFPWVIIILIVGAIIIIIVAGIIIFKEPKKDNEDEIVPTEEEKKNLDDIDTYNEEARLIAQNNIDEQEIAQDEATDDEELNDTVQNNIVEAEENIVDEKEIGDYEEQQSPTMDIDEALSDLINTKEYDFKDK